VSGLHLLAPRRPVRADPAGARRALLRWPPAPPSCRTVAQQPLPPSSRRCAFSSQPSKPQHRAVSGPACRLRCRPTALAPPNRLLRKLLAAEGLPRAARRQARNLPGLRTLGHARPPTRENLQHSHRASGCGAVYCASDLERSDTRSSCPLIRPDSAWAAGVSLDSAPGWCDTWEYPRRGTQP
jgi:hypothetical protein